MATISPLPSGSYRVRIRRKGMKSLDKSFKSEHEANEWARETESKQMVGHTAHSNAPGSMTVLKAWQGYQLSTIYGEKAPRTRQREVSAMKAIIRLLGEYSLTSLTGPIIQIEFIDKRAREKRKNDFIQGDTIRIEIATLGAILKWAKRRGYIQEVTTRLADFEMPKLGKRNARITREQEQDLYMAAHGYCEALAKKAIEERKEPNWSPLYWLHFVMDTGTRPGEAAKLKMEWIQNAGTEIHIPKEEHKPGTDRIIIVRKGALSKAMAQASKAKSTYLFFSISRKGIPTPLKYSGPYRKIRLLAGVPKEACPHIMRHERISRLFETTSLSDSQIAALVGDKDTASLRPYTHLRTSELREKLEEHQADEDRKALHGIMEREFKKASLNRS